MENNDSFLDSSYTVPKGPSDYLKFEDGENKIRILSKPLVGWSYWSLQNKPVRIAGIQKPIVDKSLIQTDKYGFQDCHHFWALTIYDYKAKAIKVLELNQPSLMNRIKELSQSADWGNPFGYDITINKIKESGKTKYTVTPLPPKPVSEEVKAAFKAKPCNLNALLSGGNPFETKAPGNTPTVKSEPEYSVENPDPSSGLPF